MSSFRPLYAVTITDAVAAGDLEQLKKLEAEAQEHLNQYGDIATLLAALKIEIAKAEA
ncbi:DUF1843 domain-containing protein [Caulobacter sp. 602-2]|uniref:DUF1843 domain-containing protein n=1 Tax=Caulobacter sp. 602-2 TaxID=2710887 RepID=A0A6G4QRA3_9CAUL|nr:DUF1843 domain-containing protein [Caulobacter sp. 602-2]NGM48071.1 DUF1843 domain-containing protein [Caulobacter sp. 602-2]